MNAPLVISNLTGASLCLQFLKRGIFHKEILPVIKVSPVGWGILLTINSFESYFGLVFPIN
ncbi:hypothetical protein NIES592_22450 [Fischerella major NIES-592]|uniref:Uncharacterized protein n=2 Tax=Fischerella TaxID=1190 RepID=A0A1U7GTF2_9CYAN|nr:MULTISPECIES: hypothetical protein [Fischerella]OKH11206.1 hypothetical protein NIES592_22450 [Fischerella major NIES-592]PMB47659.1 hypothetical protein CEN41_03075 [Fischerella thermalis CCMEE 5330]BAU06007.1 hypothetical protein FIS3754_19180 [Fischerella sp. NIES-3754]BCX08290.1 MAG: hypothetical protein KatS3mg066_2149 [Fischerella sp.]